MSARVLPHAPETEAALLGAIMLRNDMFHDVAAIVGAEDFHVARHRVVWEGMARLSERDIGIDPVTLLGEIESRDQLGLVGGLEGLGKLNDGFVVSTNAEAHARKLRDLARRRRLVLAAREVAEAGVDAVEDEAEFLDASERKLLEASERKDDRTYETTTNIVHGTMSSILDRMKRKDPVIGIPTGITALDRMIGGLQPGKLYVIAGRPGHGKSALAGTMIQRAAFVGMGGQPCPSLNINLEMGRDEIVERHILARCYQRSDRKPVGLRERMEEGRISADDWQDIATAGGEIHKAPIAIDDDEGVTAAEITARARRWRRGKDCGKGKPALIAVDYLQLIESMTNGKKNSTREQEIAATSRAMKRMAKALQVPVLLLSQLNRGPDSRDDHRPRMSDLRESGAIEQDADVIMFVYRPCMYIEDQTSPEYLASQYDSEIIVGKQRGGKKGIVRSQYIGAYYTFQNPPEDSRNARR